MILNSFSFSNSFSHSGTFGGSFGVSNNLYAVSAKDCGNTNEVIKVL